MKAASEKGLLSPLVSPSTQQYRSTLSMTICTEISVRSEAKKSIWLGLSLSLHLSFSALALPRTVAAAFSPALAHTRTR